MAKNRRRASSSGQTASAHRPTSQQTRGNTAAQERLRRQREEEDGGWLSSLRTGAGSLLDAAEEQLSDAADTVREAAESASDRASEVFGAVHEEAREALQEAEQLGAEQVERGRQLAERVETGARRIRQAASRREAQARQRVEEGTEQVLQAGREVREEIAARVDAGARTAMHTAQDAVDSVAEAVDPVGRLTRGLDNEGDSRTMAAGALFALEGRVSNELQITITRGPGEPPSWSVSMAGDLGAGAALSASESDVSQLGVEAMGHYGVAQEHEFANEVELERGLNVMMQQMMNASPNAISIDTGTHVNDNISQEDLEMMGRSNRAMELRADIAAQVALSLGVQGESEGTRVNAGQLQAQSTGTVRARVETPDGAGGETLLVIVREVQTQGQAAQGTDVSHGGGGASLEYFSGSASVTVRYEDRYRLRDGVGAEDILGDPLGACEGATHQTRLVLSQEQSIGGAGNRRGTQREMTLTSDGDLLDEEARERLMRGDVAGSFEHLDESVEVSRREEAFETDGIDIRPGGTVAGVGGNLHIQNTRRRVRDRSETSGERLRDVL